MTEVHFYDSVEDELLKFAVIVSKYQNQWVYCKHKERATFEVPGGHRDSGEDILAAAKRELFEETGAIIYDIYPVCVYSVKNTINKETQNHNEKQELDEESYGMLYFANIKEFGPMPDSEMEKVVFFDSLPENLTYPHIQPKLISKIEEIVNKY
ncbi:DNA mismatch repair protein MutT [Anaerocolumna cellulosilytica]|uniref:DNA mismatch repair protein MutT n=1 Tax=Anaerocolumna cellulosilytica TaxID=433286 RepID=A0A6S6R797_9FIRM|nr:NUDIX domain-containing protein [Anaerocolumna cellulosilytica]MBB5197079.1 8-oxo-dGTP diphosphatase [Anaerocolumna cellulosilytica]BCJ95292.1 DNA mismatch repair protein MutT [Anaerocolumna cellulosilytica]